MSSDAVISDSDVPCLALPSDSAGSVESPAAISHAHSQSNLAKSRKPNRRNDGQELRSRVAELSSQLREKEQLIGALTERLEQAAEQLDRIRRTGSDRGLRSPGGLPADLADTQKSLIQKLEHALQQWEDLQAATALGRLEVQVSELRELVAANLKERNLLASPTKSTALGPRSCAAPAGGGADSGGAERRWESLKAEILARDTRSHTQHPDEEGYSPPRDDSQHAISEPAEAPPKDSPATQLDNAALCTQAIEMAAVAVPEPVDPAETDPDRLRGGIEARDAYISCLLKKLKMIPTANPPIDWATLQNAPDELRARLQELETQLREKVRFAEVDHSLERARLARAEAGLHQREVQLESRARRLGLQLDDGDRTAQTSGEESGRKRKWLKFLSRTTTDDASDTHSS